MFWISLHFQPYILVRTIGTFQIHEIFHQITLESTSDLLGLELYIFVISALMKFFRLHFTQLSLIIETKIKCKYLKSPWDFLDKREVSPVWLWQTWPKRLNPKANLQFYWLIKAFYVFAKNRKYVNYCMKSKDMLRFFIQIYMHCKSFFYFLWNVLIITLRSMSTCKNEIVDQTFNLLRYVLIKTI